MTISSVGFRSSGMVQSLVDMRNQLADLQRQLGTGKKSDTYAGLGIDRGLTVGLRAHLSALSGYGDAMSNVGVRLDLAQTVLTRIDAIGREVKSATTTAPDAATKQQTARNSLAEMLGLLNSQAGDRYIFSGRATDQPAVETVDHILDGDGARAGLKQVIGERNQADLGASGLGRLVVSQPSASSVSLAEDANSPFGFKLLSAASSTTGATVSGPSGSPQTASVDFGATNPAAGDTVSFAFALPDGSHETLTLTATSSPTPGDNQFTIGADSAATAANLQAALTNSLGKLARTSLAAASALAAANDFFNANAANPPQRVDGLPFDSATALIDGTPANTVIWYTGDAGSSPARSTAAARIDQSISVSYGVRANEQAIRSTAQNVAALAAMTSAPSDPDADARYAALSQRVRAALDGVPGTQSVADIEVELGGAQATIAAAKNRHQQTTATLSDLLQQIEGVSIDEVGAKVLALQTSLQASLQTTAMLYQTSILKYL